MHAQLSGRPIAVFDSGVGGLSVWRQIVRLLPDESTIYLADQAHVPYGGRSASEIATLTETAVAWLIGQGAGVVVIACHTATAGALSGLRQRWPDLPFVGMEPAVKPASEHSLTRRVGVMATPGTLQAERFSSLVQRFAAGVEVHTVICPGLVEQIEAGKLEGPELEANLHAYLDPLLQTGIDHLVLGCTHYPFLAPAIQRVVGEAVTLVDPAPAVARQVARVLAQHDGQTAVGSAAQHQFYTTGDSRRFAHSLARLLHLPFPSATHITLPEPLTSDL